MQRKVFSGKTITLIACTILCCVCAATLYIKMSSQDALYTMFADTRMIVEVKANAKENLIEMNRELEQIPGIIKVEYKEAKAAQKQLSTDIGMSIDGFMGGKTVLPNTFVLTIGGTTLLQENGISDIATKLSTLRWVARHNYDSDLTQEMRNSFQKISDVALFVALAVGATSLIMYFAVLSLSIGAVFNCYPRAAYNQLGAQAHRWAWVHGALSALIGGGIVATTVAVLGINYPLLGLATDKLPLICCLLMVGSVLVSQFCTYIVVMLKK